jgi:hypothetical protein
MIPNKIIKVIFLKEEMINSGYSDDFIMHSNINKYIKNYPAPRPRLKGSDASLKTVHLVGNAPQAVRGVLLLLMWQVYLLGDSLYFHLYEFGWSSNKLSQRLLMPW